MAADPDFGIAFARVGASPGFHSTLGQVTIVDIDPKNTGQFYVAYEALKPNLFLAGKDYIADKVYGSRIYQVHKNTVGIIFVAAGMFVMMGFLPVFIEAGFAGVIYEVLVSFAADKVAQQASEIHPVFGVIVGLAAETLAPRPDFTAKVVQPAGLNKPRGKAVRGR